MSTLKLHRIGLSGKGSVRYDFESKGMLVACEGPAANQGAIPVGDVGEASSGNGTGTACKVAGLQHDLVTLVQYLKPEVFILRVSYHWLSLLNWIIKNLRSMKAFAMSRLVISSCACLKFCPVIL